MLGSSQRAAGCGQPTAGSRQLAAHVRLAMVAAFAAVFTVVSVSAQSTSSTKHAMEQDPACQSLMPAAVGGPMPTGQDTLVVRWLGWTNYELSYRGNVFLLDTYYDRGPGQHPIGVMPKDF